MAMSPRLLRPRASGAFSPRSISGLALWLDADDTSTITVDQGASEWRDKSVAGSTKKFVQATGNEQPATGTETMNGKNVLRFDGSNDRMTATDPFLSGTGNGLPFSLFIVQRVIAATNFGMTYTTGGGFELRQNSIAGAMQVVHLGADAIHTFTGSSVGVDQLFTLIFPSGATNNLFYERGTLQSLSGVAQGKPSTLTTVHTIGRRFNANLPANVRIAEIIAYQAQLSDAQRQTVERYLGKKWGITVA
jgi:hypothetical protein